MEITVDNVRITSTVELNFLYRTLMESSIETIDTLEMLRAVESEIVERNFKGGTKCQS